MRIVGPTILIIVGVVMLLDKQGLFPAAEFFRNWWPLILIAIGIGLLLTRHQRRP